MNLPSNLSKTFHRQALVAAFLIFMSAASVMVASSTPASAKTKTTTSSTSTTTTTQAPNPVTLTSIEPGNGANSVSWTSKIVLHLSGALATKSPLPTLTPAVAGHWSRTTTSSFTFKPTGYLVPGTTYTITLPSGPKGLVTASGAHLGHTITSRFGTIGASLVRLQQFLAELHYLPVTFAPPREKAAKALSDESTNASLVSYVPRAGSFAPTYANTPEQLISLFKPGVWNVLDKSAIISFETVHNLPVDGIPSGRVWGAVAAAVAARQVDPSPYNYLLVSETLPERLNVWSNGVVVFSTLANTGAPGAATPVGTWPVWLRFVSTTMAGTNPNGSKYDDPDIPDVSYFYGSDAVHGFVRASYGFPQSDGCVELPLAAATTVYRYDPIGTLVTVTTGVLHA